MSKEQKNEKIPQIEPGMDAAEAVTRSGNPAKPQGEDGEKMLQRMNESHYEVTGWGLGFWKIEETDTILDIGCGGGATLFRMAEQIRSGHLTGLDYSEVSVETSRRTNEASILAGKMDVLEGSVADLPFAENSFDKIITVESFYFWPDAQENLKEVLRVLKPHGTFLLVADIYGKDDLEQSILDNVERYHLLNPTKEEFEQYFTTAGFKQVSVHTKEGTHWICVEGHK